MHHSDFALLQFFFIFSLAGEPFVMCVLLSTQPQTT